MNSSLVAMDDDGSMLRGSVPLSGCPADLALAMFTDPTLLGRWWGGQLGTDLVIGGRYAVRFAGLDQTMAGQLVSYEPARFLEFTWSWDHEAGTPRRTVAVRIDDTQAAELAIEHGPYGDDEEEAKARAEHLAGWQHFLPRLASCLAEAGQDKRI